MNMGGMFTDEEIQEAANLIWEETFPEDEYKVEKMDKKQTE